MTFRLPLYYGYKVSFKVKDYLKDKYHQSENEILEEQRWIQEAKKNPEAFRLLYDKYFNVIFNYVYRRTEHEDITADLVSQTFLKGLQNLKKFEFRGLPLSAWLYKIADNEVKKHYKKNKIKPILSLEGPVLLSFIEESSNEEMENESSEVLQLLSVELQNLNTEDLSILELRFFEEKGFKEIAYILEISESKAKMRTYRALEKLKKRLGMKKMNSYD